jgi:heme oxygenase (mycobilin-producing)
VSVVFINCFEVPGEEEAEFLSLWREVNAHMQTRPGYLGHRLHRTLQPESRFRFVNVAHWTSQEAWHAAHDEEFRRLVGQRAWSRFRSTPALCEVVDTGRNPSA